MAENLAASVISAPGEGAAMVQRENLKLAVPLLGGAGGLAAPLFINRAVDGATSESIWRLSARGAEVLVGLGLGTDGIRKYSPGENDELTKAFFGIAMAAEGTLEFFTIPLAELGGKSIYSAVLDAVAGILPPAQGTELKKLLTDGFRFDMKRPGTSPQVTNGKSGTPIGMQPAPYTQPAGVRSVSNGSVAPSQPTAVTKREDSSIVGRAIKNGLLRQVSVGQ